VQIVQPVYLPTSPDYLVVQECYTFLYILLYDALWPSFSHASVCRPDSLVLLMLIVISAIVSVAAT